MLNRLTDSLDFQAQALTLRSERQRLIASNIANADTPGYTARELDFSQALRDATSSSNSDNGRVAGRLATSQAGHIATAAAGSGSDRTLLYAAASQNSIDSNTVDMDRERASFADNSVKYEATLRFISAHVRTTLSAINGQ